MCKCVYVQMNNKGVILSVPKDGARAFKNVIATGGRNLLRVISMNYKISLRVRNDKEY